MKKDGRGRPKKDVPFDEEKVKEYISRLFLLEQEIKTLREDKSALKDEFKEQVDMKLVSKIIGLVKAETRLRLMSNSSDQTNNDIAEIIKDKINMVM